MGVRKERVGILREGKGGGTSGTGLPFPGKKKGMGKLGENQKKGGRENWGVDVKMKLRGVKENLILEEKKTQRKKRK